MPPLRKAHTQPALQTRLLVFIIVTHDPVRSDLALTLSLDAQQLARPELRLVVMSATLGGGLAPRLSRLMSGAAADVAAAPGAEAAAGAAGTAAGAGLGARAAAGPAAGARVGPAAGPAAGAGQEEAAGAGEAAQSAPIPVTFMPPGQVPIVVSEGRSYPVGECMTRVAFASLWAPAAPPCVIPWVIAWSGTPGRVRPPFPSLTNPANVLHSPADVC